MIPEQRHALILDEIDRKRSASIAELGERLNVTRETVRRDIAILDDRNLLRQVRGGAVAVERVETSVARRVDTNPAGKSRIAAAAAALVPDGATVIIDSGTTLRAVARELTKKKDLIVLTNDVQVALLLLDAAREVHMLGGTLDRDEQSTRGHDAIDMVRCYPADFALIGVGGLSAKHGFTDFSRDGARLREAMIEVASVSVMLADRTKFGKVASVQLRDARRVGYLVTDAGLPEDIGRYIAENRIELVR